MSTASYIMWILPQVSKVKGYTVASLENYSSVSQVSVYMRAGSRFETYNTQGLTHILRKCAFLVSGKKWSGCGSEFSFFYPREMINGQHLWLLGLLIFLGQL